MSRPSCTFTAALVALGLCIITAPGEPSGVAVAATLPSCAGTQVTPRDDLAAVVATHPPGTTFCLREGVYRMTSRADLKPGDQLLGAKGTTLKGSRFYGISGTGVVSGWP